MRYSEGLYQSPDYRGRLDQHLYIQLSVVPSSEVLISQKKDDLPDEGWIDFERMIRKMHEDNYDGIISVEFVSAPDVIEAGWDIRKESARLKEILDDAVAKIQG